MEDYTQIKQEIVKIAKKEYHAGMVNMFEGNISVRVEDRFLITPSQVDKDIMTPEMIVEVDAQGNVLNDTGYNASSELMMHLEIYRLRSDINAVVHNHSMYATAFAMNHMPIRTDCLAEINQFLEEVPVVPYGTPGTSRIYEHFEEIISDRFALLLANHGVVTFAADLEHAFSFAEAVEKVAQQIFISKLLGNPVPIDAAEIKSLKEHSEKARQAVIAATSKAARV